MKRGWSELLFQVYKECRGLPGWADLYEFYEPEDREYFMQLDDLYGN